MLYCHSLFDVCQFESLFCCKILFENLTKWVNTVREEGQGLTEENREGD